jgi:histone deacetylase complex regulatory component SIN3
LKFGTEHWQETELRFPSVTANPARMTTKPLNVRDALSYLDEVSCRPRDRARPRPCSNQVKSQFWEHPQIYNRFLEVMKVRPSTANPCAGL